MSSSNLLNTVKRLQRDLTNENLSTLTEKIYQIWINSGSTRNILTEGYRLVDYLEELIREQQTFNDQFFILICCVLAKNATFFHTFLIDEKHFEKLFKSSIPKPIHLLRYLDLLYFYCPTSLINTDGHKFFRFVLDTSLLPHLRRISRDIDWLAAFSTLLVQFHSKSTESIFTTHTDALDFCKSTIETFLQHSLKIKVSKDFLYDLKLINTISKVLSILWRDGSPSSIELESIEHLFISMFNSSSFSSAILAVFSRIHLDAAEITVKTMFNDGRMTGERLGIFIKLLIELIDAPIQLIQPMPFDTWVTGLCTALISFQHQEFLLKLIDQTTSFLVERLFHDETAENAFQILFWFVRYDKRIETFLVVLNRLSNLFERFQQKSNEDFETKLVELCQMAVTIHPDYDLANETRLKEILRRFPHPDLNVLSNHRYIHSRLHSVVSDSSTLVKHRVGIVNHGNTCYVSSVLQALYQCDLFRKYLLEHRFSDQPVLRELQILFAQLNLSKRSSISSINLIKVARPSWFNNNEQQDCAEFLGYLLDTIKDEEKKEKNRSNFETERLFTIRTKQINRCQRCSKESSREESSNYLFLPIPTTTTTPVSKSSNSSIRSQSSPPAYDNENSFLNLQNIFDSYFQKEDLKDENQYRCEFCRSLQDAERHIILQTAPEYLILSLNRFEYEKQTNIFRKIFTKMNYPKVLNVQIQTPSENKRISTKYCLVSIIVHTGYTLHGGHYYVYAREIKPLNFSTNDNPEDYFTDDEWFLLNDDQVTASSYQALIDNCSNYTSATPYILIYRRIDAERIESMKENSQIRVHSSLTNQIDEDNNQIYRQEQDQEK